jgi:hypothetical protein
VYTKNNGQIYPSQILYTGNGSIDGNFSVDFTLENRPDTAQNFAPGFQVLTTSRVSKITASITGNVVREYNLSYTAGNNGYHSLLSSIQENGWDANHQNLVTSPATSFGYISSTTSFVAPAKTPNHVYSSAWIVTDANGDGLNDITNSYIASGATSSILIQDNSTSFTPGMPEYWATDPYCSGCTDTHMPVERGVRYVDVDADVRATNALDKSNTGTGTSANPTTTNIVTSTSSELYFGVAWSAGDGDTWTAPAGSGYTLRENETDNDLAERIATEDAVIASGTTTAVRLKTTTNAAYAAAIASFNPASTGGGSSTSADATSSQTALWKNATTSFFGGASYKVATASRGARGRSQRDGNHHPIGARGGGIGVGDRAGCRLAALAQPPSATSTQTTSAAPA